MSSLRRKELLKRLSARGAGAAVICSPADILYLTGARVSGYLLISPDYCRLYISSVEYEEQKKQSDDDVECIEFYGKIPWNDICKPVAAVPTALDTAGLPVAVYREIEKRAGSVVDVPGAVMDMRAVKDENEISVIREACYITEQILHDIDIESFIGKSEQELAGHLLNEAWKQGMGVSFEPVVACGKNSAYPHHLPSADIIERGWLKIDFGIRYKNYCSDLTRTYILDKFIDNCDSEKLFFVLKEAQDRAAAALRPHARCSDIYEAARKHLSDSGIGDYFIHGLGHGVGLEVHEKPYLRGSDEGVILPGMTVTLEPGFYIPGKGGMRIEDVFLITEEGSERLTRISQ